MVTLEWKDPVNCGMVPLGGEARRRITIRNTANGPVSLRIVQTSCKCVVTSIETTMLEPGKTTTLDVSVVVSGGVGGQRHTATLEAATIPPEGSNLSRVRETHHVPIAFTPSREYEIFPRQASTTVIVGREVSIPIHVLRKTAGDLLIEDPITDLNGLRVNNAKISEANECVQVLTVVGSIGEEGVASGLVRFSTNSEKIPVGQVELSVRGLSAWRTNGGGVVFALDAHHPAPAERQVTFTRRVPDAPAMTRVEPVAPTPGLATSLSSNGESVTVKIDPSRLVRPTGAVDVRVFDVDGHIIATIPVVWYRHQLPVNQGDSGKKN